MLITTRETNNLPQDIELTIYKNNLILKVESYTLLDTFKNIVVFQTYDIKGTFVPLRVGETFNFKPSDKCMVFSSKYFTFNGDGETWTISRINGVHYSCDS